jgi:hypothetical protein
VAAALLGLAEVERCEGNAARVAALAEESLSIYREQSRSLPYGQSFRHGIGGALRKLGEPAFEERDGPRAAALFAESMGLYRELGPDDLGLASAGIAGCLAGSGEVAVAAGRPERGARLLAAAQALLERRSARLTPSCQSVYDRSAAAARAALGEAAFAAALAEGRAMPLEQATAWALEEPRAAARP